MKVFFRRQKLHGGYNEWPADLGELPAAGSMVGTDNEGQQWVVGRVYTIVEVVPREVPPPFSPLVSMEERRAIKQQIERQNPS
jgi:hypothetical protein